MASIKRRVDRGNRWEVRYRDPEGKQKARLFDRRVDAERFLTGTEHSTLTGSYVDPALGRMTFAQFLTDQYRPTMVSLRPPVVGEKCGSDQGVPGRRALHKERNTW